MIFAGSGSFRASQALKTLACVAARRNRATKPRDAKNTFLSTLHHTSDLIAQVSSLIAATRGKGHRNRCLISLYVLYYPTTTRIQREVPFQNKTSCIFFFAAKPCNTIFKRFPIVVTGLEYLTKGRKSLDGDIN